MDGVELIAAERARQVLGEGYALDHDDEHKDGSLAVAAACYAQTPRLRRQRTEDDVPYDWPWEDTSWKPADRIRELAKAGALIAAEIDRLQRSEQAVWTALPPDPRPLTPRGWPRVTERLWRLIG